MTNRILKLIIGIFGASGVALGAFGAHALKTRLAAGGHTDTWETAVFYHLIHTVAMLVLAGQIGAKAQATSARYLTAAVWFWLCGILLFSGSLYLLSLDGPKWLGPVTPLGGLALLLGWGCILANGLKSTASSENK
jgi:uncharacterized membrane protein YgdD (TMEM256/DUF423 family)